MREYLFELRKKANKTQKEISRYIFEKYDVKTDYMNVELGRTWKDLAGDRSVILAAALNTTPEYILKCEAEQGGYTGRYSPVSGYDNPHKVKRGRRTEYDEPFTDEEKVLIEEYLPYVNKVISRLKYGRYKSCLGVFMTADDFYDIGVLAFLRTVKSLTVQKCEDPEYFNTIEELVPFYRFNFSRSIKHAYTQYVSKALTSRRKASINALALDAEVRDCETDEDFYNFIPNRDLPIPIVVESSWTLDKLYSYLNKKQIRVCKMLISGWTTGEIIKYEYASQRDIGIIRFYLDQFKKYGKILWRAEDYKIDTPNIHFSFVSQCWKFLIWYKQKAYSMGLYKDLNDALDLQLIAHSHIIAGDFIQWHKAHLTLNSANVMVFTYPLPYDKDVDFSSLPSLSEKPKFERKITRATKENPIGIFAKGKSGAYTVVFGSKYISSCKTFDEALNLRHIVEDHYIAGDLDSWCADFKAQKEKENAAKPTYARMEKTMSNGSVKYIIRGSYHGKAYSLGTYSYEEAVKVKGLADNHIDAGDFTEWAIPFYELHKAENRLRQSKRMRKAVGTTPYEAAFVICKYLIGMYRLLCYDTCGSEHLVCETTDVEEAYKTMDLANEHIEAGDFNAWFADYKNI